MKRFLKTLGPGILFASTAIGVSHLIQSTQAGSNFGFTLLWAIVLANLFKYPFFEYGSRYASATGTSIIEGFSKLGKPVIWLFFVITLVSMFLVTAAVANVTAGFMQNLFGISNGLLTLSILFVVCIGFLISGKYNILDSLTKIIGVVLFVSTIAAFIMVLFKGKQGQLSLWSYNNFPKEAYWAFLVPLMGWMPTAVDLSAWNSIWTLERIRQTGYKPSLKETLFEFNFGYWISAFLAICFLTLGAFMMFGTGKTFSESGVKFSGEVIQLYTDTFGNWSYLLIAVSAFSIMFGTCIAVFDGYSRAMSVTLKQLFKRSDEHLPDRRLYRLLLLIISAGSLTLIMVYQNDPGGFRKLVDLATSTSFLFAPVVALFNILLVRKKYVGAEYVPSVFNRILSYAGLLFLTIFSVFYLFRDYFIQQF